MPRPKPTEAQLRASLLRRFWEKVDKRGPDDCWPWTGSLRSGYGVLSSGHSGKVYAHRLALEIQLDRPLEDDEHALHRCDFKPCSNPGHLFAGSNADNADDARVKGLRMKAACRRGHLKTSENTYIRVDSRGYIERHCLTCRR